MIEPGEFTDSSIPKEVFIDSSLSQSSDKFKNVDELKPQLESEQDAISDFIEEISESADETIKDSLDSVLPRDDETIGNIQLEVGFSELTDRTPQSADIEINAEIAFSETISNTLSKLDEDKTQSPVLSPICEKVSANFNVQKFITQEISMSSSEGEAEIKPVAGGESPDKMPLEREIVLTLEKREEALLPTAPVDVKDLNLETDEHVSKRGRKRLKKEPKIEVLSPKKDTEQPLFKQEADVQLEKSISIPEDEIKLTVSKTYDTVSPNVEDSKLISTKTHQSINTVVHTTVNRHRTIKKTIKKIIYVNGKEQECSEVVEEPYTVEFAEEEPSVNVQEHEVLDHNKPSSSSIEIVEAPVEYPVETQYEEDEAKGEYVEKDRSIIPEDKDESVTIVQEPVDRNLQIITVSERNEDPVETSVVYTVSEEPQRHVTEEGIITTSQKTVIQQRTVVKRIVRRVVIINGIEHIHEESFEEPQMLDAVTSPGISFDLPSLTVPSETAIVSNTIETTSYPSGRAEEVVRFADTVDEASLGQVTQPSGDNFEPQNIPEIKSTEIIQSLGEETVSSPKEQTVSQSFIELETKEAITEKLKEKSGKPVKKEEKRISTKVMPGKEKKETVKYQGTAEPTVMKITKAKEETLPDVEIVSAPVDKSKITEENVEIQPKVEEDINATKKFEKKKQQPKKAKKSKSNKTSDIKVSPGVVESFIEMERQTEPVEIDTSKINISTSFGESASPPTTPKTKEKITKKLDIVPSKQPEKDASSGVTLEEESKLILSPASVEQETKVFKTPEPEIISVRPKLPVSVGVDFEDQIDRSVHLKVVKPSQEVEIVAEEVCESLITKPTESLNQQNTGESVHDIIEVEPTIRKDNKGILEDVGKQSSTEIGGPDEETNKREKELFALRELSTAENLPLQETSQLDREAQDHVATEGDMQKPRKKKTKGAKKPTKRSDEDINVSINTTIASDKFEATSKIEVVQEYPIATNITGGLYVALDPESSNSENVPEHQIRYEVKIGEGTESVQKPTSDEETSESVSFISYETDLPSHSSESSRPVDSPSSHEKGEVVYDIDTSSNQYPIVQINVDEKIDDLSKENITLNESEQVPIQEAKDELIVAIKDKLSNLNSPSYKVLLREPNNENKLKELQLNLDKLGECKNEEKELLIISTVTVISECLETITYIIYNFKVILSVNNI